MTITGMALIRLSWESVETTLQAVNRQIENLTKLRVRDLLSDEEFTKGREAHPKFRIFNERADQITIKGKTRVGKLAKAGHMLSYIPTMLAALWGVLFVYVMGLAMWSRVVDYIRHS